MKIALFSLVLLLVVGIFCFWYLDDKKITRDCESRSISDSEAKLFRVFEERNGKKYITICS